MGLSVQEVVTYAILAGVLNGIPCRRILQRAGFSPWLAALVFVPWLGYLALELLVGFATWPALRPRATRTGTH
jgi:hypothetical protein